MTSNESEGALWEKEVIEHYRSDGWMAIFIPKSPDGGQPCDIIALKDEEAILIECKVCTTDSLYLGRIEDNQLATMRLAEKTGNSGRIYVKHMSKNGKITKYIVWWDQILATIDAGQKSFSISDMYQIL